MNTDDLALAVKALHTTVASEWLTGPDQRISDLRIWNDDERAAIRAVEDGLDLPVGTRY